MATSRPDSHPGSRVESSHPSAAVRTSAVVAVGAALLAVLLSIFALGRALATDPAPVSAVSSADISGNDDSVAEEVSVSLTEFTIAASAPQVPAGLVEVVNDGSAPHNLAVRDTDLTTADLASGDTGTLDLSGLEPGTYQWLCTIPGHEQAGMVGEVTVVEAGEKVDVAAGSEEEGVSDSGYMTKQEADAKMANMMASLEAFPAETQGKGVQVMEPTKVLEDGTKVFELVADEVDWEVAPGKTVKAMAYNGQIPGPTIKVDLGDRYVVRVVNMLDNEDTSLHPHGVNGHALKYDGVAPITQDPVAPGGGVYEYVFEASEPSLGMYHSHVHSLTQVPDGLVGAIIAGDYAEVTGQEGVTQEHVMVLNDAGVIGFSLNGKSFPATQPYVAEQGERLLVHYMNEGVMAHPMHLHGQTGWVVAKDGFPLPQPYRADTINVAPGERYSVVYDAEEPGTWVWHCHILGHVKQPDGSMFGMLTALVVEEAGGGSAAGGDMGTDVVPGQLPDELAGTGDHDGGHGDGHAGSSTDGSTAGEPQVVAVSMEEFSFSPSAVELEAGTYTFEVSNDGQVPHEWALAAAGDHTGHGAATRELDPGESERVTVELAPGEYSFMCHLAGHLEAGMEGSLVVAG